MQSVAFTVPVLAGKTEVDRRAMQSTRTERKREYEASRQRHGIVRENVSLQQGPAGDVAVVYLEAEDLAAAFTGLATSQDPFDRWFRDIVLECHGIDLTQGMETPEVLVDYRRATAGATS